LNKFPENVIALQEAEDDFVNLDRTQQLQVLKAIVKTASNPKPKPDGYGNPLRKELSVFCKIKLKKAGIRFHRGSIFGTQAGLTATVKNSKINLKQ